MKTVDQPFADLPICGYCTNVLWKHLCTNFKHNNWPVIVSNWCRHFRCGMYGFQAYHELLLSRGLAARRTPFSLQSVKRGENLSVATKVPTSARHARLEHSTLDAQLGTVIQFGHRWSWPSVFFSFVVNCYERKIVIAQCGKPSS